MPEIFHSFSYGHTITAFPVCVNIPFLQKNMGGKITQRRHNFLFLPQKCIYSVNTHSYLSHQYGKLKKVENPRYWIFRDSIGYEVIIKTE